MGVTARPAGCGSACVSQRMPWAVEATGEAEKGSVCVRKQGGPLSLKRKACWATCGRSEGREPGGQGTQAC